MFIERIVLDDGQVIQGTLENLDKFQLISWANQLMRKNKKNEAQEIMRYQHRKFVKSNPPPEAA